MSCSGGSCHDPLAVTEEQELASKHLTSAITLDPRSKLQGMSPFTSSMHETLMAAHKMKGGVDG